jgi:hypothetical protein
VFKPQPGGDQGIICLSPAQICRCRIGICVGAAGYTRGDDAREAGVAQVLLVAVVGEDLRDGSIRSNAIAMLKTILLL